MYTVRKLKEFNKVVLLGPGNKAIESSVFDERIPGSEERAMREMSERAEIMNSCWNRQYTHATGCTTPQR